MEGAAGGWELARRACVVKGIGVNEWFFRLTRSENVYTLVGSNYDHFIIWKTIIAGTNFIGKLLYLLVAVESVL